MTTYSHRNGETEPPTEYGYYWMWGGMTTEDDPRAVYGVHTVLWVTPERFGGVDYLFLSYGVSEMTEKVRLPNVLCRFWGPIVPPWEAEP